MKLSRRNLIKSGLIGVASAAIGAAPALADHRKRVKSAKNIIFCVADGMAMQTVSICDEYQRYVFGRRSYWAELLNQEFVTNGLQVTASLNSVVTDSSAASSAWGCGRHIWNGMVNEFPDGTKLRTLSSLAKEKAMRVGLVTTTTITHATPAGFAVNCSQRDLEALIAEEYLTSSVDVLMGGGDKFFSPAERKDKKDVYGDFRAKGYRVIKNRKELMAGGLGNRVLGVFSDGHLPYTVDRDNSPALQESVPTLAEMAKTAISLLDGTAGGFLLQIEGGRVDHGGHSNDLAGMIYDQIAFEQAVKVAVDYALNDKNTLVIITSDHACGGPSLNGAGNEYIDSTAGLRSIEKMKASYSVISKEILAKPTTAGIKEVMMNRLGIELTNDECDAIVGGATNNSPFKVSQFYRSMTSTLAAILGNHSKVTWTSGNHTSDHVLVTAIGPGSEAVAGITENVALFDIMLAAKSTKWSNPTMTFEAAKPLYDKMKQKIDPELLTMYASHDDESDFHHGF